MLREDIENVVAAVAPLDDKISSVAGLIWDEIEVQLQDNVDRLAQELVCGQVEYPRVVELVCRLP